ncbi:MAG: glycosyltransferase [Candidatus Limiplasma sp.]|nr:glycosyltransferase [Candidatus Limiplasma sp.]
MALADPSLWADQSWLGMLLAILLLLVFFAVAKKWPRWRVPFLFLSIGYNVVYLVWRIGYTLPLSYGVLSAVLGIILLLAECMGFFQSAVYRLLFVKPYRQQPRLLSEWPAPPTVDVLIATYNESLSILEKTLLACLNLDYPADRLQICLYDDGRRDEVRALCESLGVRYLTRDNSLHAKAGNLNSALAQTGGEYVLLLDADMVPKSYFLQKTLGYFLDARVGFVQTPQVFYNPDPFQFNLHFNRKIPNEQDFFMLDIQAARANYNAVLHVGTNAVFRRSALDAIGGIPTGTITEDMATGMLLQAKGYQSIFVREVLCTGLSVESFSDLIRQRERWCRGNIQVTKKWNPLTLKGLSTAQRIIYLDGLVYWFFGVQKMIYLLCPLIYLIFGTVILRASVHDLLLFWFPSYMASLLSYRALTNRSRSLSWSHIYEVAMAPYLAMAALVEAIFSRPIPFRVTPKGLNTARRSFAIRTSIPYLLLLALTVLGWVLTWTSIRGGNADSLLLNAAWSLYNAIAVAMSILVCVERPRKRVAERITVDEPITVSTDPGVACHIVDISETGAKIVCEPSTTPKTVGETVDLTSPQLGTVEGKIIWKQSGGKKDTFAVVFNKNPLTVRRKVIKVISDQNKGYHDN